ncbi:protein kinase [Candidatus Saganbacteria bacterium]|nr:protein kinase [Candidatus Saganbacteria bacterium]
MTKFLLPMAMSLASLFISYFGSTGLPSALKLLAWVLGGAALGELARRNVSLVAANEEVKKTTTPDIIFQPLAGIDGRPDSDLALYLMTAREQDKGREANFWKLRAGGESTVTICGKSFNNDNRKTYDIVREIGAGGMAFVMGGVAASGKIVALKVVGDVTNQELIERIIKGEFRNQDRSRGNPGIVSVFDLVFIPRDDYRQIIILRERQKRQDLIFKLAECISMMSPGAENTRQYRQAKQWLETENFLADLSIESIDQCNRTCEGKLYDLRPLWDLWLSPRLIPETVPILVTEYIPGAITLADCLGKDLFTLRMIFGLVNQLMNTLDELWRQHSIIHRDLKPDNFFLCLIEDYEDRVSAASGDNITVTKYIVRSKIGDFGIAKHLSKPGAPPAATDLTGGPRMLGSLEYMAVEQLRKGEATVASDVFAMGIILYLLLTDGKYLPFALYKREREDYQPLTKEILGQNLQGLSDVQIGYLNTFFTAILSPEPKQRFQGQTPGWWDVRIAFRSLAVSVGIALDPASVITASTIVNKYTY